MDFLELTKNRYSCRSYQSASVEDAKLAYIMECVRMAPSACNRQPWRFRIVSDDALRSGLAQCYNRDWFRTAPVCIVASLLHDVEWVRADGKRHGDIDVAIAVEHLCLAAAEQGLATCWVCNFDAKACHELLAMDANEEPVVLIPLGYAADEANPKVRKSMDELCS